MQRRYLRHLKSLALQVVIFAVFVFSMQYFQTRQMAVGRVAQFELLAISQDTVAIPSNNAGQISLIYFFAPWCRVCKLSMSNLNKIQGEMPDLNIQIIALDYESKEEVLEFVKGLGISVPVFFGNEDVRQAWSITAYPSYYVLDKNGVIRARSVGYSSKYGMMAKVYWSKWFG